MSWLWKNLYHFFLNNLRLNLLFIHRFYYHFCLFLGFRNFINFRDIIVNYFFFQMREIFEFVLRVSRTTANKLLYLHNFSIIFRLYNSYKLFHYFGLY